MKTITSKHLARSIAAIALAAAGSSAFAASTWDLQAGCGTLGNAFSGACTGAATGASLTGFSTGTGTSSTPTTGTTFAAATIYNWGSAGLGVVASNELSAPAGPHAIDNGYGTDALLINFTAGPISLTNVKIGYNGTSNTDTNDNNGSGTTGGGTAITYNDSDLSVLAWTGSGAPPLAGSGLQSAGWTLVGNYANVGAAANTSAIVSSLIYSSYWLISAYNSAYFSGTSTQEANAGLSGGNDSFKLLSVAGNTKPPGNKTPEPGSLALMGLALVGMVTLRRRQKATGSAV